MNQRAFCRFQVASSDKAAWSAIFAPWRRIVAVFLVLAFAGPLAQPTQANAANQGQMVFVLTDGSIVRGRLLQRLQTGYLVRTNGGERFLAFEQVREASSDGASESAGPPPTASASLRGDEERKPEVPGRGMATVGWILFGSGLGVGVGALVLYDEDRNCTYSYSSLYGSETHCYKDDSYLGLAAFGGAVAATGLTLAIIGLVRRSAAKSRLRAWERDRGVPESDARITPPTRTPLPASTASVDTSSWTVVPTVSPNGTFALSLRGSF